MKTLLTYNNFLNEKYQEEPSHRIRKFLEELEKNIKFWFEDGSFAASGSELVDVKIDTLNSLEKTLKADFLSSDFYHQIIFVLTLEEVEEDILDECHIKIKRYDLDQSSLIREISDNIKVKDINEDSVLDIFTKLDDASVSILDDAESGSGNVDSLSDDETDLEDTDIF